MSRLTVTIDDELLSTTQELLGTKTKRETIVVALREVRQRRLQQRMLEDAGRLDLGFGVDELLERRRKP